MKIGKVETKHDGATTTYLAFYDTKSHLLKEICGKYTDYELRSYKLEQNEIIIGGKSRTYNTEAQNLWPFDFKIARIPLYEKKINKNHY